MSFDETPHLITQRPQNLYKKPTSWRGVKLLKLKTHHISNPYVLLIMTYRVYWTIKQFVERFSLITPYIILPTI